VHGLEVFLLLAGPGQISQPFKKAEKLIIYLFTFIPVDTHALRYGQKIIEMFHKTAKLGCKSANFSV
jgi:hypothetical protein